MQKNLIHHTIICKKQDLNILICKIDIEDQNVAVKKSPCTSQNGLGYQGKQMLQSTGWGIGKNKCCQLLGRVLESKFFLLSSRKINAPVEGGVFGVGMFPFTGQGIKKASQFWIRGYSLFICQMYGNKVGNFNCQLVKVPLSNKLFPGIYRNFRKNKIIHPCMSMNKHFLENFPKCI